jgi:hypothetical protein
VKKLTGTRPRPIVRTERESVVKRLRQAGRAYDAGRSIEANEARITRLENRLIQIDTPPAPVVEEPAPTESDRVAVEEPTVEEIGTLVIDPIFGEVLEIEMEPLDEEILRAGFAAYESEHDR